MDIAALLDASRAWFTPALLWKVVAPAPSCPPCTLTCPPVTCGSLSCAGAATTTTSTWSWGLLAGVLLLGTVLGAILGHRLPSVEIPSVEILTKGQSSASVVDEGEVQVLTPAALRRR